MNDPGDEVASRFDYQYTYAAIRAAGLVAGAGLYTEVICENHEDFLLKTEAGTYVGTQIKTRKITLPPFKATENQVISALAKFCRLDSQFVSCFEGLSLIHI